MLFLREANPIPPLYSCSTLLPVIYARERFLSKYSAKNESGQQFIHRGYSAACQQSGGTNVGQPPGIAEK